MLLGQFASIGGAIASTNAAHAEQGGRSLLEVLFGASQPEPISSRTPRSLPVSQNDLRDGATPWRSAAMLEALDDAIGRFEKIVRRGGWPHISGTRMIRPEDNDDRVPVLRQRLAVTAEYLGDAATRHIVESDLETGVRLFQVAHGLRVSGRVERSTIAAMNVSAEARLAQLKLNRQRLLDLISPAPEDRYVLVNAAAFQLEAVERGVVQLRHRTITGKPDRQTPNLRAMIRAVNFFPFWRVPDSIATLDLIPRLRKEPEYLAREKIRALRGSFSGPEIDPSTLNWAVAQASQIKFRQDPGPQNALGLLRIDMPNAEGVYLHDTPMKELFQQTSRAFSAGCVRVQNASKLVDWLARQEKGWADQGRSEDVIAAGHAIDLNLAKRVPVYFDYITAWAEPSNGQIMFRPDIYGRDGIRETSGTHDSREALSGSDSLAP